jgi:tetratricopeptide (TPR) repeat protein
MMEPLFVAVSHGCAAGRHREALDEVYRQRISRHGKHFHWRHLGAFGSGLAALAGFFDPPWRRPVAGLDGPAQGFVLNLAGDGLQALGRLEEAIQPMQAALDNWLAHKNWMQAAIAAGNLSDLYLVRGNLVEAVVTAQRGVAVADRSGDPFWRMAGRTALAEALHQAGRLEEARELFQEAETIQKEGRPEYPYLYAWRGFLYCDLLLSCGAYETALERAAQLLERDNPAERLPDGAFHHLTLGRSHLVMLAQANVRGDVAQATVHLKQAIDGLRQAGTPLQLLRGLLAQAALHRVSGSFGQAQRDLAEARIIAGRGGMRLYRVDLDLESARLALTQGDEVEARRHLEAALALIEEMGYHRRDGEAAELAEALNG